MPSADIRQFNHSVCHTTTDRKTEQVKIALKKQHSSYNLLNTMANKAVPCSFLWRQGVFL
jgi:hypothetical protein